MMNDKDFYNKYFEEYLELYPTMNDYLNYSKMKHLKKFYENSISPEHIAKTKRFYKKYQVLLLRRMMAKKKRNNAGDDANMYYDDVLKYEIDISLEGFKYPLEYMPIDQMSNVITDYMEWMNGGGLYLFEKDVDYLLFIHKTKDFSILCNQMIVNMKKGIKKGYVLPTIICQMTIDDIKMALDSKSYVNQNVPKKYKTQWDTMVNNYFLKPVNELLEFMMTEYLPKCRATIGYSHLPNGKELYQYIVRNFTTLDITAEEVHKIGVGEVERIYKEMIDVKKRYGFKGTQNEFNEFLRNDKLLHFHDADTLIKAYKDEQNVIMNTVIPRNFDISPSYNYLIDTVPKYMEDSQSAAYYWSGDIEGKRKGKFYINLRDINSMSKIDVEVLSLHEGNPGHHFQQTLMMENQDIPLFIKAGDYVSYVEGWGLYAENLGNYEDILSYYGKLNFEIMRAIRLVVDTGIHYYDWSFDKCKKYFLKYTSLPVSEIDAEIYRYIAMPGQALGYKIGELTFIELRKKFVASKINGKNGKNGKNKKCSVNGCENETLNKKTIDNMRINFKHPSKDIKEFHRKILEKGNAPLKVLVNYI